MTGEAAHVREVSRLKFVLSMPMPSFGTCLTEKMHRLGEMRRLESDYRENRQILFSY